MLFLTPAAFRMTGYSLPAWMPGLGEWTLGKISAESQLRSGDIQRGLRSEEALLRVGLRIEADDDLGVFHGIVNAVVEGIAERLQQV
jgi:hypothetical protein